jgi:hypothetical protein
MAGISEWRPIAEADKSRPVIVGLVMGARVYRCEIAVYVHIGWFAFAGGASCHWATHYVSVPPIGQQA